MKRLLCLSLVVCGLLGLGASAEAATDPERAWAQAKTFLRQGAYRDALESFDVILVATPNDPWAQLYHALCELRLESQQPFGQLSPEQVKALQQKLKQEERQQRRATAQQKAVERQIKKEQDKWDRELTALQRKADLADKRKRQDAQVDAVKRLRAERARRRVAAVRRAVESAQPSPPQESEAVAPSAPSVSREPAAPSEETAQEETSQEETPSTELGAPLGTAGESPVELSPVVVPTTPVPATGEGQTAPSLKGRARPPAGTVQINARQMSVSPDRKIAIADGDVEVLYEEAFLTCDHLTLFTDTKDVYAEGRVRLEQGTQVFRGEMVHYNFETKKGRFLQGTVSSPPWHEHGRSMEHLAEGVYEVTPGYITSCNLEPPHFQFYGSRAIVFADDKIAKAKGVTFFVEKTPFIFLPWMTVADRQPPFYIIPGKKKPWGPFALMGYRYELPALPGGGEQRGTLKMDWRRFFKWGFGLDHQIDSPTLGASLLKIYYNKERNMNKTVEETPKGALEHRYRILWRHRWTPLPDTTIITDYEKFSDIDFRKEYLFREEFTRDDAPETFISSVTNTKAYTLTALLKKRVNRFQTLTESLPQITFDVRSQRIGETNLFSESKLEFVNFHTKRAHSNSDTDVNRFDWFQQLKYALNLFRPVEVTPRAGVRQTFYTTDRQGSDREGQRNFLSGQGTAGVDTSLKLFRVYPVVTNALGLNLNWLRHVVTPTIGYTYAHRPTILNDFLNFPAASAAVSQVTFGLEHKLQTRRPNSRGKLQSVDLARFLISVPYNFRSNGNKQGGRLNDWAYDLEVYPVPWLRLETDWNTVSHRDPRVLDNRTKTWNLDLVMVGGRGEPKAQYAPEIQAPVYQPFQPGPREGTELLPQGQWYVGLGHRYSQNDKTEDVLQIDWRLSEKWQVGIFERFTWKEVIGSLKRFNNLREYQYSLRRDLHDWIGEFVYRVDREFGEEIYLTLTLKAYPNLPIATSTSYHEPKLGSQSSPFSPIHTTQ